jgi:hypothetical protein
MMKLKFVLEGHGPLNIHMCVRPTHSGRGDRYLEQLIILAEMQMKVRRRLQFLNLEMIGSRVFCVSDHFDLSRGEIWGGGKRSGQEKCGRRPSALPFGLSKRGSGENERVRRSLLIFQIQLGPDEPSTQDSRRHGNTATRTAYGNGHALPEFLGAGGPIMATTTFAVSRSARKGHTSKARDLLSSVLFFCGELRRRTSSSMRRGKPL